MVQYGLDHGFDFKRVMILGQTILLELKQLIDAKSVSN